MKILLIKTSALGDVIQAFSALHYLKQSVDCRVHWMIEERFAEVAAAHPQIDQVVPVDTKEARRSLSYLKELRRQIRRESYDLVIDLQGNIKSGFLMGLARAPRKVGFAYGQVPEWPNILFSNARYTTSCGPNQRATYVEMTQRALGKPPVPFVDPGCLLHVSAQDRYTAELPAGSLLFCPGAAWESKRIPSALAAELLLELKGRKILLAWGSDEERLLCEQIADATGAQILPRLSLPALQELMSRMEGVIAMDSMPLHLAGMAGVPTFGIFGPSSPEAYAPGAYFQGTCPFGQTFTKRCKELRRCSEAPCTHGMDADALKRALAGWMEASIASRRG